MRILFLGDTVGRSGREAAAAALPGLRAALRIDLAVVNAENASHGFGLAPDMAEALFAAGADVITLGNHAWDRKEIIPYIAQQPRLLRPLNFPPGTPGAGSVVVDVPGGRRALVMNAMGRLFMDPLDCPFRGTAEMLSRYRLGGTVHAIVCDFHAEATSEKLSYGHQLRRPGVAGGRHPHPCADRRPPGAGPRHRLPVRCRHVRRLRQRDRHGEGGRAARFCARCPASGWRRPRGRPRSAACSSRPTTPPGWRCAPNRCGSAAVCRRRCRSEPGA